MFNGLFACTFIFSLYNIDTFAHKRIENKMTDSKYFTTTKKGEIFELKSELNSDKKEKKKEAVKKVTKELSFNWRLIWFDRSISMLPTYFIFRWLLAWQLEKMYQLYFLMLLIACKPIIWNWRSWFTCTWWIMRNLSQIWLLWQWTHSSRFVYSFTQTNNFPWSFLTFWFFLDTSHLKNIIWNRTLCFYVGNCYFLFESFSSIIIYICWYLLVCLVICLSNNSFWFDYTIILNTSTLRNKTANNY